MTVEKRESSRNPVEAPFHFSLLTASSDARHIDGILRNFSSKGAYIESRWPYQKGSLVIVRTLKYPHKTVDSGSQDVVRSISLAEVKWVHPVAGDGWHGYGICLKYLH